MDFWPRNASDAAIMKNIRALIFVSVAVLAFLGMAKPVAAQSIFVELVPDRQISVPDPSPVLKDVLPLVFADSSKTDVGGSQDDSTLFAPLYIDNSKGVIAPKVVTTKKVMPIDDDVMKGISTYFSKGHPGIDYRADFGTPIHAIMDGAVNEIGYDRGGYGRYIVLVHHLDGQVIFSLYAHMSAVKIALGDIVSAGDIIGQVGLTGHTTGPHVHFELHTVISAIDPLKFFAQSTSVLAQNK